MFRRPRTAERSARAIAVGFTGLLILASCSSGAPEDPTAAFCSLADDFESFQSGLSTALFDQAETKDFFEGSLDRLNRLVEAAPPTIEDDVMTVRDAFVELDEAMAEVDHNILEVDERALDNSSSAEASDRLDRFLLANCRDEGDPFVSPEDPNAPRPFSDSELAGLAPEGEDDAVVAATIASQLAEELGLAPADARCVVDEMDLSTLAALADGEAVTDDDAAAFAAALETCDVRLDG